MDSKPQREDLNFDAGGACDRSTRNAMALCFDWQTFNIKSQLGHIHIDSGAVNGSLVDLTLRGIALKENFSFSTEKRETASRFLSKDKERGSF